MTIYGVMADTIVISEVLCFMFNKFGKFTKMQMKSTLLGFYAETELDAAKDQLFGDSAKLNLDDRPRNVKRSNRGDDRVRLVVDDLLDLCAYLDEKGCFPSLPTYVARCLDRVPLIKIEDMELFCLAKKTDELEKRLSADVERLASNLDRVRSHIDSQCSDVISAVEGRITSVLQSTVQSFSATQQPVSAGVQPVTAAQSWSEASDDLVTDAMPQSGASTEWTVAVNKKKKKSSAAAPPPPPPPAAAAPQRRHILRGKSNASSGVKGVPRQLYAFVSRLASDTTEEALTSWLADIGILDAVCKKIVPKDGRVFRSAAFRVSCESRYADLFYDEANWPEGAELRDWVFKNANVRAS